MADIKSRLQLDGEQEYKKALNDAYRSLRVLRSELKAETAELGKNATAQDKAGKKADSLKKQIEQQKKIVETLKKALADSKKEYADNQEVQDKWAEKLNKAREQLANMQNQMQSAQDAMHKFGDSMRDVSDSSGEAAQGVISINDCLKSIGSIAGGVGNTLSGIFTSTVDTMKAMVDEMYALMGEAWAAAGDWKQIQTMWGGNLTDIERVMSGAQLQGVDTGEITGGIQKLVANVHSKNKETMKALKKLGLKESGYDSHWDFFEAVMKELAGRQGKERDLLAAQLFGDKKGAGMVDVADNWAGINQKYFENVKGTGMELSSPEIEALDEVAHKITEIQGMWQQIRMNIGAKLSEILNMDQLGEDTMNILRDVAKILNSDDKAEIVLTMEEHLNKLIEDISKSMTDLSDFVSQLATALQTSTNPVLQSIGNLLASLSGVLKWVSDNSDNIIEALNKLLPWMLRNKVLEATTGEGFGGWANTLTQFGFGITQVTLLGKIFGQSASSAMGAGAMGTAMGTGFGAALMSTVPWLAGLLTLITPSTADSSTLTDDQIKQQEQLTEQAHAAGLAFADEYVKALAEAGKRGMGLQEYLQGLQNAAMAAGEAFPYHRYTPQEEEAAPKTQPTPYQFSYDQIMAAQNYWDAMRTDSDTSDEFEQLRSVFEDDTSVLQNLLNKITEKYNADPAAEFLPASLFQQIMSSNNKPVELKTQNQITVNVNVDGETVQRNVSEHMAKSLMRLVGA